MSGRSSATGASHLVAALIEAGVERLFSLSGNQILSIYDACLDAGLEIIHVRHEAAAVHMADAWGRLTGRPGVALLTAGPGHANGLTGLIVAREAESPLVVLSGQSARADDGRGSFQEMPQAQLAQPLSKAAWTAEHSGSLGDDVRRALDLAVQGRPGPVAVSLPSDVLEAEAPRSDGAFAVPDVSALTEADRRRVGELFAAADRPIILAGPAMMRPPASVDLEQLEAATGIPVVSSESPRGVNDPSLGAFAEVLAQADFLLLLGKRLDHSLQFGAPPFFAADACFAQVDADVAELDRTRRNVRPPQRLALAVEAHPGQAARQLAAVAESAADDGWREAVRAAVDHRPAAWDAWQSPPEGPLHPIELCQSIRPWVDDGIVVIDGGEFGQWAQALLSGRRRVINGPAGSIGTAIPFALAARLFDREAPIVAIEGDGTAGYHLLEFDTAVRHDLPFVAVVGNDAGWNAERRLQARTYGEDRIFACDLLPTRYDLAVAALGGHGEHVTKRSGLDAALERAFASGLPSLVNVAIEPAEAPIVRREGTPVRTGH
ncbi:MAG: thiamine pyrophosphate-binding protein [Chloroflexota bacterium]|nr:thiamine pyrophosphate-binding protein [Chloroflexota bacterium]